MIRFKDTTTLALTKLRTRKIRLFITIFVSGLLFSALAASSIVARGGFSSIDKFSEEGFGKRYIVSAFRQQVYDFFQNEAVINRAIEINKDLIKRKTAEAKRLNITYDPTSELSPVQEFENGAEKMRFLSPEHPAAEQAISEYLATQEKPDLDTLKAVTKDYDAVDFYQSTPAAMGEYAFKVLKDGKESFEESKGFDHAMPSGLDSFSQMWQSFDKDMLTPFALPGQNFETTDGGEIPVIIPVSAAEELLGLTKLPSSAKASERLNRIKDIRARAAGIKFDVCIRNNQSTSLISQALAAKQDVDANKNNKDYVKPDLMYGLPETACGAVPIARDVRTAEAKRQQAKQDEFDKIFGKENPSQQIISFRITGVVPDLDAGAASTVGQIIRGLVISSLGTGWFTPSEYLDARPELKEIFGGGNTLFAMPPMYYAEFATDDAARRFIDEQSCGPNYEALGDTSAKSNDPYAKCEEQGKYFELAAFGSNSLALESAKRSFGKFFRYGALAVAVIAAVIMMGTVGRMIADSRRETAVFRAIGAKRIDIAQVYVFYTILLSLLICLFAVLAGVLLAGFVHGRYSTEVTVEALVAFNAQDLNRVFKLYALYWPDLLQLAGLALVGGIISSILPLLRNLRRNPIRDMRDDT